MIASEWSQVSLLSESSLFSERVKSLFWVSEVVFWVTVIQDDISHHDERNTLIQTCTHYTLLTFGYGQKNSNPTLSKCGNTFADSWSNNNISLWVFLKQEEGCKLQLSSNHILNFLTFSSSFSWDDFFTQYHKITVHSLDVGNSRICVHYYMRVWVDQTTKEWKLRRRKDERKERRDE